MEIIIRGPFTRDKFFVEVINNSSSVKYTGSYNAGEWSFELFDDKNVLVLKSERERLSRKKTFFGHEHYLISWEDKNIAVLSKAYFKKVITYKGEELSFPGLRRREIPELGLKFPLTSMLYRRKVKSLCESQDPQNIMMSIAITIFVWFTWNALNAD